MGMPLDADLSGVTHAQYIHVTHKAFPSSDGWKVTISTIFVEPAR